MIYSHLLLFVRGWFSQGEAGQSTEEHSVGFEEEEEEEEEEVGA